MAVQRATECGLGPVTVRYDDELQSDILTVTNGVSASEGQLICLDKAVGWGILAELSQSVQPKFDNIREARAAEMMRADAHEWLSKRGLLARLPKYVEGTTDEAVFTGDLEHFCGPHAKGAFESQYGFHVLSPEWIKKLLKSPKPERLDTMSCLIRATTAAGFKLNFIGNEAYVPNK